MSKLFGTDGVRGIANQELTCELAIKIGKAAAIVLSGDLKTRKPKILIGKDTRISSDMLEAALLSGISSYGAEGISLGVIPTPAVSYLVRKYQADAGIMISASHNSFEFNGIKLFDKDGYKLSDETEKEIEELILNTDLEHYNLPIGEELGTITKCANAVDDYVEYLSSMADISEDNIKIAVDCANGCASATAKKLFEKLKINAEIIFDSPNGTNINEKCGSTHLESLQKYVIKNNCNVGFAFDGDADRCLAIDENGRTLDGDIIMAICAKSLKNAGKLKNNTLVATIMSNMGLKIFCQENDIKFSETKVGDRYVLERMKSENYILGGEQSGHVIFLDHSRSGDGELTAIQLLNIIKRSGKKISELANEMKKYPQKSSELTIDISQKGSLEKNENIKKYISDKTEQLGSLGRIVIRESGTEPKIRIMFEHENENILDTLIAEAKSIIQDNLK